MDLNRIIKNKSFYFSIFSISLIIVSIILLNNQDKRIEILARQLYSPKSLLYKQEKELKLIATCTGGLSLPNDENTYYYLVQLKIENKTTKIQEFITYSCSVLTNILTDNADVIFFYQNCASNYPVRIELKPNQQFELPIMIQVKRYDSNKKIKFGYVILRPKNIRDDFISRQLSEMRNKQESVIWSKRIELNETSFEPFNIEDIIIPLKPIQ